MENLIISFPQANTKYFCAYLRLSALITVPTVTNLRLEGVIYMMLPDEN